MENIWNAIGLAVGLAFYGGIAAWNMRKPLLAAMERMGAIVCVSH